MQRIISLSIVLALCLPFIGNAQTDGEWKTETFVTGYLALNGEYIDLDVFEQVKGKKAGIDLAEASVLTTVRPLEKLKINSVVTYKPRLGVSDIITELSGEWEFSSALKIKAGRFLLPLHPANSQYYAPMNVGIALPIFVTNHSLFPLNINGVNIAGDINFTDQISLCYNISGGQYTKKSRTEAGVLGFFGRDGVYLNENAQQVSQMISQIESLENGVYPDYMGAGGKACLQIADIAKIGGAVFYAVEESKMQQDPTTVLKTDVEMLNYGANFVLDYSNITMKASAWFGNEVPDMSEFKEYHTKLYYGEFAYNFGKISPYSKVEVIDGREKAWTRATFGLNIRPLFETTFKLEYHRYFQDYTDDFNIFQASVVYSF